MNLFFEAYRPKSFSAAEIALALHEMAKEKPEYLQRFGIDVGLLNSRISLEIDDSGINIENSLKEERDKTCLKLEKYRGTDKEEKIIREIMETDRKIENLYNYKFKGVYKEDGKKIRLYSNKELNEFARRIWWKGYKWQELISKK